MIFLALVFLVVLGITFFSLLTFSIFRDIKKGVFDYDQFFSSSTQLSAEELSNLASASSAAVSVDDDPSVGNLKNPKVTIIAFEDFQCPFCGEEFSVVKTIIDEYKNDILFVYRDFPLEVAHPEAKKAAEAGECADDQGKFWEMHDIIFQHQDQMQVEDLIDYARQIGLNTGVFRSCLTSGKYSDEVNKDFFDGASAGVTGTPTFFINGVRVPGAIPLDVFRQLIESEIRKADINTNSSL